MRNCKPVRIFYNHCVSLRYQHAGFSGQVGVARADITPPAGIYARNWGAAKHDAATGIHRPLNLTALVLRETADAAPLVLVDADLGWWRSLKLEQRFRAAIIDHFDLDPSRYIFALTHTHAGPLLTDQVEPHWEGGDLIEPWFQSVELKTRQVITDALKNQQPGIVEWHFGRCQLASERDLADPTVEKPGRLCGFNPGAVADDTLLVGRVSGRDGNILAVIGNYACHPTTLAWDNELISPDYIGAMRETVEREHPGAVALFLQGASGDLAPRMQYVGDTAIADGHGRQLGHAMLATLADMEPPEQRLAFHGPMESGAPLALWRREPAEYPNRLDSLNPGVELTLQDWPSADEFESQRLATSDRVLQERCLRKRDIRRGLGDGPTFELPVWLWRIGDAILVANMCEAYSSIQKNLRKQFPDHPLIYLNLANGSVGYLPPDSRYDEDVYQVWQTPFERGSLERLEQGIGDQIKTWMATHDGSKTTMNNDRHE